MGVFGGLLNPETIKAIIVVVLLIFVLTGRAGKIIGNIIRGQVDKW